MSRSPVSLTPEQRIERARRWAVSKGFDAFADDLEERRVARAAHWAMSRGFYNVTVDLLRALADLSDPKERA